MNIKYIPERKNLREVRQLAVGTIFCYDSDNWYIVTSNNNITCLNTGQVFDYRDGGEYAGRIFTEGQLILSK